jgi:membrane protein DedA with SNARE-associated domain/rhodanese-related sulfurtransferase
MTDLVSRTGGKARKYDPLTHFLLQHGYMVVFAGVLAEQLGLPFPSGSLLLAAGALLGTHRLNAVATLGTAITASLISDSVWYCLGRRRGGAILVHACSVSLDPDTCVSQMHRVYSRFGAKALLFCKFVPGLGTLGPPMAGMVGLAPWKFLSLDAGGAFVWAGNYVLLGWLFRYQLETLTAGMARFSALFGGLIGLTLAAYVTAKFIQRRRIYRTLMVAKITPAELKRRMDARENLVILDVRTVDERREGRIPGSLQFEQDKLSSILPEISHAEVILYSSSPNEEEDARAALQLQRRGVRRVRPLEGGFEGWHSLGLPVEQSAAQAGPI